MLKFCAPRAAFLDTILLECSAGTAQCLHAGAGGARTCAQERIGQRFCAAHLSRCCLHAYIGLSQMTDFKASIWLTDICFKLHVGCVMMSRLDPEVSHWRVSAAAYCLRHLSVTNLIVLIVARMLSVPFLQLLLTASKINLFTSVHKQALFVHTMTNVR